MRGCGDGDAGLPPVWDDQSTSLGGEVADSLRLGQPADAPHVGLGNVDATPIHQIEELVAGREPFTCGDLDRRASCQLGVAVQVVCP